MAEPQSYPHELVEQAFLDDGTAVLFRPVRPDDKPRFERLFDRLSPLSLYRRFFTPVTRPHNAMLDRLVTVDYADRLALVAEIDDEIVAVTRYDRLAAIAPSALHLSPDEAEIAVIVEDAWQGRGLATRLLWRLTAAARARGIRAFTAEVQGDNRPMMGLLHVLADDLEVELADGAYHVRMALDRMRPP